MRGFILGSVAAVSLLGCGGDDGTPVVPASSADLPRAAIAGDPPATSASTPAAAAAPAPSASPPAAKLGPPYPILLMHGMGGFGTLEVGPLEVTYFDGVVEALTKNGEAVTATLAPPYATSEVRAQAVAAQIDAILSRTGKAKVNLVAHSQGGLDARVIASPNGLGYGDRVASITTIATPHRGSRVADAVVGLIKGLPASVVDDVTGAILSVLQKTAYELKTDSALREQILELSEKHMKEVFNPKYIDAPGVVYKSYAGRSNLRTGLFACQGSVYPNEPTKLDPAQLPLLPTALFLEAGRFEVNDGFVTVESAKWGTFEQCVPADHMKEVGQLGPSAASFDHVQLYKDVVARIRQAGL